MYYWNILVGSPKVNACNLIWSRSKELFHSYRECEYDATLDSFTGDDIDSPKWLLIVQKDIWSKDYNVVVDADKNCGFQWVFFDKDVISDGGGNKLHITNISPKKFKDLGSCIIDGLLSRWGNQHIGLIETRLKQ